MKQLTCEMCGSNDLIKKDGVFVCQYCGAKYSVEEAKNMFGAVKIDKTEEIQNLLILARRARDEQNSENATKYYSMILEADPNNWEAAFFQVYFRAMQCKVGEICYYAQSISNNLVSIGELLLNADEAEKIRALNTITSPCLMIADLFASVAEDNYNKYSTLDGAFKQCVDTIVEANVIIASVEFLTKHLSKDKKLVVPVQKHYINYLNKYNRFLKKDVINTKIAELSNEIRQVEPTYNTPSVNNGGCYIATAVYGSYDCPQVWTLRRYRDYFLAKTWYGRAFIHSYYAISPHFVKWFGHTNWFKKFWKHNLDYIVESLHTNGVDSTPYEDQKW